MVDDVLIEPVHFPVTASTGRCASARADGADPTIIEERSRAHPRLFSLAVLLAAPALVIGTFQRRNQIQEQLRLIADLPARAAVLLALAVCIHKVVHASILMASLPGLRLRRALVINEIHTGFNNVALGGAAIGTALKASLLRGDGWRDHDIAASVLCTGVACRAALWFVAWAAALAAVGIGHGGWPEATVLTVGSVGMLLFWFVSWRLRQPGSCHTVVRCVERSRIVAVRLLPRRHRDRLLAANLDLQTEKVFISGRAMLAQRRVLLGASSIGSQATIFTVLLVSVRTVSPVAVNTLQLAVLFAVVRVAASMSPLPGGLGALDLGLAAGLGDLGVPSSAAISALAIFRGLTFLLPVVLGTLSLSIERVRTRSVSIACVAT